MFQSHTGHSKSKYIHLWYLEALTCKLGIFLKDQLPAVTNEIYNAVADQWKTWLTDEALSTFRKGKMDNKIVYIFYLASLPNWWRLGLSWKGKSLLFQCCFCLWTAKHFTYGLSTTMISVTAHQVESFPASMIASVFKKTWVKEITFLQIMVWKKSIHLSLKAVKE